MKRRTKIKVVKKSEVGIPSTPDITETPQEQDNTSELTSTVSGWVSEFREKRREERESAIEQFYS